MSKGELEVISVADPPRTVHLAVYGVLPTAAPWSWLRFNSSYGVPRLSGIAYERVYELPGPFCVTLLIKDTLLPEIKAKSLLNCFCFNYCTRSPILDCVV